MDVSVEVGLWDGEAFAALWALIPNEAYYTVNADDTLLIGWMPELSDNIGPMISVEIGEYLIKDQYGTLSTATPQMLLEFIDNHATQIPMSMRASNIMEFEGS